MGGILCGMQLRLNIGTVQNSGMRRTRDSEHHRDQGTHLLRCSGSCTPVDSELRVRIEEAGAMIFVRLNAAIAYPAYRSAGDGGVFHS